MKNKGFTLVELLAVIVILAVIALIAVPIILNVIETSKKGAIKDSAYGLISASEVYVANNLKNGTSETVKFNCSNNKCVSDDNKEISFKGKVAHGTLIISNSGKVLVCVDDGENYALKLENDEKVTNGEGTCGLYEESNGTFAIISDIDALRAQYEQQLADLEAAHQETVDQLNYELEHKKITRVVIGESDTRATRTFDVKTLIPDYQNLTSENFSFSHAGYNAAYQSGSDKNAGAREPSYDPSTGMVTVPSSYEVWNGYNFYTSYTLICSYIAE